MRRFIYQVWVFTVSFMVLYLMGSLLLKYLVSETLNFKLDNKMSAVILGHSHTECALNDSLIPNVKNLSQGGEAYFYTYQKIKKIIRKNKNIKTVFISFTNNQISDEMDRWTYDDVHINNGFPKYSSVIDYHDYVFLLEKNSGALLRAENKALLYNGKAIVLNNDIVNNDWGGYLELHEAKVDSLLKNEKIHSVLSEKQFKISTVNIIYLKKIIKICKDNGVTPVLIRLPMYPSYYQTLDDRRFHNVRNKNFKGISFYDFHDFPLEISDFRDYHHLNSRGAQKFSVYFNSLINESKYLK